MSKGLPDLKDVPIVRAALEVLGFLSPDGVKMPREMQKRINLEKRQNGGNLRSARTRFRWMPKGKFTSVAAANSCRQVTLKKPKKWDIFAFALGTHSAYTGGTSTKKAIWYTQATAGDALFNDKTWNAFAWAGASTVADPAKVGSVYGQSLSDFVYGKQLSDYIAIRTHAAANGSRAANEYTFTAGADGTLATLGMTCMSKNGVDAVADPTLFTSPTYDDKGPAISLVCLGRNEVFFILAFGGNTVDGKGDDGKLGMLDRLSQLSQDDAGPMVIAANQADQGSSSAAALLLFDGWMAVSTDADEILFPLFLDADSSESDWAASIISGDFSAPYNRIMGQIAKVRTKAWDIGARVRVFINRELPGKTGAELTHIRALRQATLDMEAKGLIDIIDGPLLFNDLTATTAAVTNTSYFTDGATGTNLNAAGHALVAQTYLTNIRAGA